jgi:hypothetical protein
MAMGPLERNWDRVIRKSETPKWLLEAEEDPTKFINSWLKTKYPFESLSFKRDFRSLNFLEDSLFYGCPNTDGTPFKSWSGFVHSYIYTDACFTKERLREFENQCHSEARNEMHLRRMYGFHIRPSMLCHSQARNEMHLRGYKCIFSEIVPLFEKEEIETIWEEMEKWFEEEGVDLEKIAQRFNANEKFEIKNNVARILSNEFLGENHSTALFCLYSRLEGFDDDHGPKYIAVTFIAGGAVTHYFQFYIKNKIAPKVLCLKNPGMVDWVCIKDTDGLFYKMITSKRAVLPPFYTDFFQCFPEYSVFIAKAQVREGLSLWTHPENFNSKYVPPCLKVKNMDIFSASEVGDIKSVRKFIEKGVDVNSKDANGNTPLMLASSHNHYLIVKELLENGAKVNEKNNNGETALMLAQSSARHNDESITRLFLENGAEANEQDLA